MRSPGRISGAIFTISFVVAVLLTAFFHVQVISGEHYALRSEENRLRPIVTPAPRGTIVDRNGEIIATTVAGYSVMMLPGSESVVRQTLEDISPFLGLSQTDLQRLVTARNGRPHDLLFITENATFAQVSALEERRTTFPSLVIADRPRRHYPAGPAVGHLVGYVAEISREELKLPRFAEEGYRQGQWIGKAGIEHEYELLLSGNDGARFVEVDAMGRVVNPHSTVSAQPPVPGETLQLTIDLGLQQYLHEIFPDTMKGAVVVMTPSTGEVLALYSHPTYDPNDFVGGPSVGLWRALSEDPRKPLLHRAIAALYPPASPWKLATAAIGLEIGVVEAGTRMPHACTGGYFYAGRYARCWYEPGHGSLDLIGAIEHSCNVYFYQLGVRIGLKRLIDAGTRMGFSSRTGLDLSGEKPGIFPEDLEWLERRFGYTPQPSEVMSLSIGQGPNSQTVLKMAHFYSAIAGNGTAPEPYLAAAPRAEGNTRGLQLDLKPEHLRTMWDGLAGVTSWERRGTARLAALERWTLYGKTGTGQNPHGGNHAWFTGFAGSPGDPPEVVVAVLVEHGLSGSDVAPLAAKAAQYYLDKKHGLPFDPQPTLGERMQTGRVDWSTVR